MKLFLHVLLLLHVSLNHSISAPSLTDARAEFFIQVELNNIGFVQNWLNQGGNINVQSHDGKTALMRACQENHKDLAKYLIHEGADLNIQNKRGITAIGLLSWQTEMVELLLKAGALVTKKDVDDAFSGGDIEMEKYHALERAYSNSVIKEKEL
jgi:ankyrin repeat protein